jgi:hypothetical protein
VLEPLATATTSAGASGAIGKENSIAGIWSKAPFGATGGTGGAEGSGGEGGESSSVAQISKPRPLVLLSLPAPGLEPASSEQRPARPSQPSSSSSSHSGRL